MAVLLWILQAVAFHAIGVIVVVLMLVAVSKVVTKGVKDGIEAKIREFKEGNGKG